MRPRPIILFRFYIIIYTMYRRRYRRRRRYGNRYRRAYKKKSSGWLGTIGKGVKMAGKALAVAQGVRSLLNVEYKYMDLDNIGAAVTPYKANPNVILMTALVQGDDSDERNGRSVKMVSLNLKLKLTQNSTYPTVPNKVYYSLFYWDEPDQGTMPGSFDQYVYNVSVPIDYDPAFMIRNPDYVKEIHVVKSGILQTKPSLDKNIDVKSIFIKANQQVKYIGTDGTQASCGRGHWYLALWSHDASGYQGDVEYKRRFTYIDN